MRPSPYALYPAVWNPPTDPANCISATSGRDTISPVKSARWNRARSAARAISAAAGPGSCQTEVKSYPGKRPGGVAVNDVRRCRCRGEKLGAREL